MNESFEWVSHPVKENRWLNLVAFAGIILFAGGAYIWIGVFGIPLGLLIAALTLHSYFLPTRYRIDEKRIYVEYMFSKKSFEWSYFKSYYIDDKGILLSPFIKQNRLENFRGLYVRFGGSRERIKEIVAERLSPK